MEQTFLIFEREVGGLPKFVTMAELEPSRYRKSEFLVYADLPYRALPNGLPLGNELDRVAKLEDKLISALVGAGFLHLGHITHKSVYRAVFRSTTKAPETIGVRASLFKEAQIRLESSHDPHWQWVEQEMIPTPLEKEISVSRALLTTLEKHGDRAEAVRPVDFAAWFPTETDRTSFIESIALNGYAKTDPGTWEPDAQPRQYWCEVKKETSIEASTIAKHCACLREQASIWNGEFDGWQTPIVR
jgi:hypothetical protein